jgi:drug/metabolite transporter (DMT)-like permease
MKSLIVVLLIILLDASGKVCLSHGVRGISVLTASPAGSMPGLSLLLNPWLDLAILLLMVASLLYTSALSWLDLSYLQPMTSLKRVLIALFAWSMLGETISPTRWVGTAIIALGVLIVGLSGQCSRDRETLLVPASEGSNPHYSLQTRNQHG